MKSMVILNYSNYGLIQHSLVGYLILFKKKKKNPLRDFCKPNSTQFQVFSFSQVIGCSYRHWTDFMGFGLVVSLSKKFPLTIINTSVTSFNLSLQNLIIRI